MSEVSSISIASHLLELGVNHLHYMAPLQNIPSIISNGILCYNKTKTFEHRDVSNSLVQHRRNTIVRDTAQTAHDFVPLYWATHTPMQYVLTHGGPLEEEDLVFLEVDAEKACSQEGVVFTDGNAASNDTTCSAQVEFLARLDWHVIRRVQNCFSKSYKRVKAAEVLVPDRVPTEWFTRIVVYHLNAAKRLYDVGMREHLAERGLKLFVDRSHYY